MFVKAFIATARSPILDQMLGWGDDEFSLFDGGIYSNGACEIIGTETTYAFLPADIFAHSLKQIRRYPDVHIAAQLADNVHALNHDLSDSALPAWGIAREELRNINDVPTDCAAKILIYYNDLIDASKPLPTSLFDNLKAFIGDRANIYLTDQGKTIQITASSKLKGIEKIRQKLGLQMNEIAVFGDDINDIEMLSHYPNSVAMGNGADEVKRIASYTTDSNDADGIAHALQNLILKDS